MFLTLTGKSSTPVLQFGTGTSTGGTGLNLGGTGGTPLKLVFGATQQGGHHFEYYV